MNPINSRSKTAVVTGGAQGIGKAVALHLAKQGYAVMIADVDREAGEEFVTPYQKIYDLYFQRTDVSIESSVQALFERVSNLFGRLDLLVNNAADAGAFNPPVSELTLEVWNRKIQTNLTAPLLCAKQASEMLSDNRGAIVNVASTRALMSEPNNEAYTASKGGLVALTHALANSLGPEVRVNAVSPGWIEVRDWKKQSEKKEPDLRELDHQQHPVGRVGRPGDVARMVSFLASSIRAGFITGQNFIVDGGMTSKMIYEP